MPAERVGERTSGVERPQVLVFEIDEATGASEGLEVGAGDASFALRRERLARSLAG
jgi:hypothetical protein